MNHQIQVLNKYCRTKDCKQQVETWMNASTIKVIIIGKIIIHIQRQLILCYISTFAKRSLQCTRSKERDSGRFYKAEEEIKNLTQLTAESILTYGKS